MQGRDGDETGLKQKYVDTKWRTTPSSCQLVVSINQCLCTSFGRANNRTTTSGVYWKEMWARLGFVGRTPSRSKVRLFVIDVA